MRTDLYVMVPWAALPVVVNAPPTSYKRSCGAFSTQLVQTKGAAYHEVITRFRLGTATNAGGVDYPTVEPAAIASINGAEAENAGEVPGEAFFERMDASDPAPVVDDPDPPAGATRGAAGIGRRGASPHPGRSAGSD